MAPKDFAELESMLEFAISLNKPVIIRYPRGSQEYDFTKHGIIKYGKSEIIRRGDDISIIAIGNRVSSALNLALSYNEKGISAEVINVRFLKPLDKNTIKKSILKTKNVITIEDGTCIGGLGSSIEELIVEEGLGDIKFKKYAWPDEFIQHGTCKELEEKYGVIPKK